MAALRCLLHRAFNLRNFSTNFVERDCSEVLDANSFEYVLQIRRQVIGLCSFLTMLLQTLRQVGGRVVGGT